MDAPMFFGFVGLFNALLLWPGLVIFFTVASRGIFDDQTPITSLFTRSLFPQKLVFVTYEFFEAVFLIRLVPSSFSGGN